MRCPTCGAENDPGNRFCDQCGTPLEAVSVAPQTVAVAAAPMPVCPNCGAAIVPGQAFCDECGTALTISMPATAAGTPAPTVLAPNTSGVMTTQEPVSPASDVQVGPVCPVCGHQNVSGDRFCDNCGAALTGDVALASATGSSDAPTMMAPGLLENPPVGNASATAAAYSVTTPDPSAPPVGEPPAIPPPPKEEPPTPTPMPEDEPPPVTPPMGEPPMGDPPSGEPPMGDPPSGEPIAVEAEAPAASVAAPAAEDAVAPPHVDTAAADATYNAEHQRLTDEIARQDQIIAQFEQMQTMFGAAAPPAVTQGLSDARDARSHAQTDLDALQPPIPAVDPVEVARLNSDIAQQGQIIAQFEQMQTMFGAAAPPAVTQGLSDARAALSRAQDALVALGGASTAVATPPAAPATTVAEPATPTPTADDALNAPTVFAPTPAASTPAAPQGARFVLEDHRELSIPDGKSEIIIGREDPISGIYPEIDLTTYGGETGGVSRQHAKLNRSNGDWTITDLNSTNYTRVDGARLEPNQPSPLKDGTRVQFGRVAMTFHA